MNGEQALQLYKQASQSGHQPASEYLQKLQCTGSTSNTKISNVTDTHKEYKTKLSKTTKQTNSEVNNKTLHMSVSAPSLQRCDQTTDYNLEDQQLNCRNKTFSISHLNLLLPYYFNLHARSSLTVPSDGQSPQVMFQVGGDDDKSIENGGRDDGAFSIAGSGFRGSPQLQTVSWAFLNTDKSQFVYLNTVTCSLESFSIWYLLPIHLDPDKNACLYAGTHANRRFVRQSGTEFIKLEYFFVAYLAGLWMRHLLYLYRITPTVLKTL